jgi:hypothetical protein
VNTPNNRRPNNRRKPNQQHQPRPVDIFAAPEELPELQRISIPANPTDVLAMTRSLGDPPITGRADARLNIEKVIARSAVIATALAFSADILDTPPS